MNEPQITSVLIEKSEWDILTGIMYVSLILLVFAVIFCIGAIRKYFKMKIRDTESLIEERNSVHEDKFTERINSGFDLLNLIVALVSSEIEQHMFTFQNLRKEYPILTLEDDIKMISERVYKALAPSIISNPSNPLQPDYIMGLITRLTSSALIEKAQAHNRSLRATMTTEE